MQAPANKTKQTSNVTDKKKSRVGVSNKVTVDKDNPIPFGNELVYSFANQTQYLPFLPPKDKFAQDLLEARLSSVTNNACVTTKKEYCAGEGFQDKKDTDIPKEITDWFGGMNLHGDNLRDINEAIFEDFFTYGNVPIEVVRLTVLGKKKLYIYPHSFQEWRLCKPNDNDVVDEAVMSKLFLRNGIVIEPDVIKKSKKLPIYNPGRADKYNWKKDKDDRSIERTLIWYKNRVTGFPYYGLPSNVASMITQLLEYKGGRYNLDMFENQMVAAAVLALKGQLGPTEAVRIGKQLVDTYTGDGKRGRTIVVASEEGIDGSDYHKMDTETDGSYHKADENWTQKIILANQWDAILAGIVAPSTFGKGANFITKIYEIKLNSVIKPAQKKLLEKVWSQIFKMAEEWLDLKFSQLDLEFKNSIDISGLTDVDISSAVTRNEVRKAKGLPEDTTPAGKEYMKSTGPQAPANKKEEGGEDVPA